MSMKALLISSARVLAALLVFGTFRASSAAGPLGYNRDIRPILSENCFSCHGPDSAARKASLRLDSFEEATASRKDNKHAIVAGKPDESEAIRRIFTSDEDDVMPPLKTKKLLLPEQKELLKRWVSEGAKYEAHWSLVAPARPAIPPVKNSSWVRSAIDAFILARLEREGLTPCAEADRGALARRVSLDLTGLPPDPSLLDSFLDDHSPDAYEHLVEKLLASEHYGEHRARYWLDAARYADTNGIHYDNYREVWTYRDWVINAFNRNMPFDEFTIEQLAGDLLPKATMEQRIATGFNRCNMTTSEAGSIDEEYLALYARDRTETTSAVWLGLTANCAVCHDHKYDPLKQREFYEMSAFFCNTTQPAMDGNQKDTPPSIVVPAKADRERWAELPAVKEAALSKVNHRRQGALDDFNAWLSRITSKEILEDVPANGLTFYAPLKESPQVSVSVLVDSHPRTLALGAPYEGVVAPAAFVTSAANVPAIPEAGDFERDQAFSFGAWIKLNPTNQNGSIFARMDEDDSYRGWDLFIDNGRPATHIVSKWPDNALKVASRKALRTNQWEHVFITYDGSSKAEGIAIYIDGEVQAVDTQKSNLDATIRTKVPFKIGQRNKGQAVENAGLQDLRLYTRALKKEEVLNVQNRPRLAYVISKPFNLRKEEEQKLLFDGYLRFYDPDFISRSKSLAAIEQEEADIKKRGAVAQVMNEKGQEAMAYVLYRGEYDKRRDRVTPGTPKMLPPFSDDLPRNRLGFAKWLFKPDQSLVARVAVNRMWQELFGTGLVRTSGDFGVSGELPSNQELLDWLAVEFRESGWNIKHMYKLIVMSAAYRQSAQMTPEKLAKDPDDRLLSRGPRFRMDAEMIRDYALSASGLLSPKIGGPSVRPYQPPGVWEMVAMIESNTRVYKQDLGNNLYRRSLYTFWKRSAPPASLDIMNAPSREVCTVRRERTDTPLQALVTLNDTQFIEAARVLAEHSLKECDTKKDRLDYLARHVLVRPLREEERTNLQDVLSEIQSHYEQNKTEAEELITVGASACDPNLDPIQLAAYTMVANELFNLDEALNK
jgi:hypothetical protein